MAYSYDANGNRTMPGYVVGPDNRILSDGTWNYSYDAENNRIGKTNILTGETWSYAYDEQNHLISAVDCTADGTLLAQVSITYDAFGRKLSETTWTPTTGSQTQKYGYDGANVWADLNGSNQLTTRYVRPDGVDGLTASESAAGVSWYLTDAQGSVRVVASSTMTPLDTITYDGFGNITSQTNAAESGRYLYTGREWDKTLGLQNNRARWYDPASGRWTTEDPWKFKAGDTNLDRYVGNSPTNATDPSGKVLVVNEGSEDFWKAFLAKYGIHGEFHRLPSISDGLFSSRTRLYFKVDPADVARVKYLQSVQNPGSRWQGFFQALATPNWGGHDYQGTTDGGEPYIGGTDLSRAERDYITQADRQGAQNTGTSVGAPPAQPRNLNLFQRVAFAFCVQQIAMAETEARKIDRGMALIPDKDELGGPLKEKWALQGVVPLVKGGLALQRAELKVAAHLVLGDANEAARGAAAFTAGSVENSTPVSWFAELERMGFPSGVDVSGLQALQATNKPQGKQKPIKGPWSAFEWMLHEAGNELDADLAKDGREAAPFVEQIVLEVATLGAEAWIGPMLLEARVVALEGRALRVTHEAAALELRGTPGALREANVLRQQAAELKLLSTQTRLDLEAAHTVEQAAGRGTGVLEALEGKASTQSLLQQEGKTARALAQADGSPESLLAAQKEVGATEGQLQQMAQSLQAKKATASPADAAKIDQALATVASRQKELQNLEKALEKLSLADRAGCFAAGVPLLAPSGAQFGRDVPGRRPDPVAFGVRPLRSAGGEVRRGGVRARGADLERVGGRTRNSHHRRASVLGVRQGVGEGGVPGGRRLVAGSRRTLASGAAWGSYGSDRDGVQPACVGLSYLLRRLCRVGLFRVGA